MACNVIRIAWGSNSIKKQHQQQQRKSTQKIIQKIIPLKSKQHTPTGMHFGKTKLNLG